VQKNFRNCDVEISSILTVYVYLSDDRIIFCLMMNKGPWGDRGARVPGVQLYVVGWSVVFIVLYDEFKVFVIFLPTVTHSQPIVTSCTTL